jgi:ATP-binding cassette, subfamily B, bacterial
MSAPTTTGPGSPHQADDELGTQDGAEGSWRGVAAEDADDIPEAVGLRLKTRSRRLLGSLLAPYKRLVLLLTVVVLLENAARLSVPRLVQVGIDAGVPPLLTGGSARTLMGVLGVLLGAVVLQAISRVVFLQVSGRIGQEVLLDLRRRLFRHFQRLDVSFHDRYTSGRVVSRMTNDVEAIQELLSNGFDGLVTAALTLVGTAVLLLTLDLKLGLACLVGFPALLLLVRWFRNASESTYRTVRESAALVIVHFVETMTGIRAVQGYRRERRNQDIFEDVSGQYRVANERSFRLFAVFMPGVKLVGNLTTGVVVLYGGWLVYHGQMTVGVLTAFLLYLRMFFEPMQEISQFYNTFQSASSALEKLSGVLEEAPAVAEPSHPVSGSATWTTARSCPAWTSSCRPGRPWRWWAPPGPARPPSPS